ncbi:MAG: MBL fold metallo-hydrolase [Fimbriimonas sp.]|nr:MBL fold metallo-hydrolase [Fimbriimonas sp.]
MRVGRFQVRVHNHGFFRLDGGAMFGTVPKTLWARETPPDDDNRVLLATRSLIVEDGERTLLIDTGCGDKWSAKNRAIYGFDEGPHLPVPGVTDLLLTHLHFDHAGGLSRYADSSQSLEPCYPSATHYVSATNYENAKTPNVRERGSYLGENIDILERVKLHLIEDGDEVWPGLTVHRLDGHTHGLTWGKLTDGDATVAFPADLIPTSKHLPVPWVMGYDICAERSMQEKQEFLARAIEESWIVVFEHDPVVAAARLSLDERGRAVVEEPVDLS